MTYFKAIPKQPSLYRMTLVYQDAQLSQPAKWLSAQADLKIKRVLLNKEGTPVFELTDGTYLEASRDYIYDDVVQEQSSVDETYWLKEGFQVYEAPYVKQTKVKKTSLQAYSKVKVTEKAQTASGTYYHIEGDGWVSSQDLSLADNRMTKVQQMLNQKYNKSNYSIYVKQLTTQTSAGINADTKMYSASIAKLATLYMTQKQLDAGKLKLTDTFKYVADVNQFEDSYDPSGSSKLPLEADNKDYTVEFLMKAVAQNSDNVATNMLGYYAEKQYNESFRKTVSSISGVDWDMKKRELSAKAAANIMEAIYHQNGTVIDYLSHTDFDNQRISKDISVQVAHKIGDAYDFKHDVAIVYAGEPFVLSILTDKVSYDDITAIANDVYAILK